MHEEGASWEFEQQQASAERMALWLSFVQASHLHACKASDSTSKIKQTDKKDPNDRRRSFQLLADARYHSLDIVQEKRQRKANKMKEPPHPTHTHSR